MSVFAARFILAASVSALFLGAPGAVAQSLDQPSIICVEVDRDLVLYEENAQLQRPPASMIKLMLMLLVVEGYGRGDWDEDTPITVSPRAAGMGGTQVYLKANETWPLDHLMQAIAVASANDAAQAVAEGLWGSEADYLAAANARAKELGMKNTVINGVHGLPPDDGVSFDLTTASDMAKLARVCVGIPEIMSLARQKELQFRPKDATKYNTNKMLWRMEDCDGLKTGFIRAAGFCVAATAERHGRRLICVIMGSPSKYGRFQLAEDLFNRFLDDYGEIQLLAKGAPIGVGVPVANGRAPMASVAAAGDVSVMLPRHLLSQLEVSATHPERLTAPVYPMTVVGELTVSLHNQTIASVPLMVAGAVAADGWYLSIQDGVARWNGLEKLNAIAGSSEGEALPEE
ncbi:MAG: D-alanyl-D-alanine carboxypeptidase [Candidatus Hydrogenedentes bacterium]|nr:D-alanyl-D-alanine carboxypeptidase [Candidatus Hydrogenedentota bacterium]